LLEQQHLLHPCRSYQEPFFAHESVFSKSPVFDVLCKSQFCEGVSMHIDLPEDDPNMLNLLLEFLYTGSFNEPKDIEGVLVAFQELYVLADKCQLFGLKTSVVRMVHEAYEGYWRDKLVPVLRDNAQDLQPRAKLGCAYQSLHGKIWSLALGDP
jgi:hypothetical protein